MAKKELNGIGDPFARVGSSVEALNTNDIGETSDVTDNMANELAAIQGLVPEEATTEDGFQRFLELMGKDLPPEAKKILAETPKEAEPKTMELAKHPLTQAQVDDVDYAPFKAVKTDVKAEAKVEEQANEDLKNKKEDKKEEKKLTTEDVLPLLDSILTKGYASETFYIRGAKVVLRSQFFWEDKKIVEISDRMSTDANFRSTEQFNFNLCALASNLVECGGNYFKPLARGTQAELDKSFQERLDFLMGMPSLLVSYMFKFRVDFVNKIQYLNEHMDDLIKAF